MATETELLAYRRTEELRAMGWAYALELIAKGMVEDADTCGREGWIHTEACLSAAADNVDELGSSIRRRLARAEEHDRAAGAQ